MNSLVAVWILAYWFQNKRSFEKAGVMARPGATFLEQAAAAGPFLKLSLLNAGRPNQVWAMVLD